MTIRLEKWTVEIEVSIDYPNIQCDSQSIILKEDGIHDGYHENDVLVPWVLIERERLL